LQLILAGAPQPHSAFEPCEPFVDPGPVPERAVLILERHELPCRIDAGGAACVVEQHQRREPPRLRLVGHQPDEHLAETDRLLAELAADEAIPFACRVPLVEDQVHHAQHATQAVG